MYTEEELRNATLCVMHRLLTVPSNVYGRAHPTKCYNDNGELRPEFVEIPQCAGRSLAAIAAREKIHCVRLLEGWGGNKKFRKPILGAYIVTALDWLRIGPRLYPERYAARIEECRADKYDRDEGRYE